MDDWNASARDPAVVLSGTPNQSRPVTARSYMDDNRPFFMETNAGRPWSDVSDARFAMAKEASAENRLTRSHSCMTAVVRRRPAQCAGLRYVVLADTVLSVRRVSTRHALSATIRT
jgi:hypothetical protein